MKAIFVLKDWWRTS
ncbi:TPA: trp operon leader peptide [Escherichia coli]|nr:trp operon leader peptide [Escherichia coli]